VPRADIETFARELGAKGQARATMEEGVPALWHTQEASQA
jgi:hypothetical protein